MKSRLPFPILYEDNDVIVIDKPAGMLTTHTKVWGRAARESQLTADNILTDYLRKVMNTLRILNRRSAKLIDFHDGYLPFEWQ